MICQKCNFQNEETAKFCRNCGAKLNATPAPHDNNGTQKPNTLGILGFAFSLIAVIPIVFPFFSFFDYNLSSFILFFAFLGFGLSIAGMITKHKKKNLSIIGFFISLFILISFILDIFGISVI